MKHTINSALAAALLDRQCGTLSGRLLAIAVPSDDWHHGPDVTAYERSARLFRD